VSAQVETEKKSGGEDGVGFADTIGAGLFGGSPFFLSHRLKEVQDR
jgi:hypothetical protein